jgi:adenosylcobinamide kinase/adenosylcobinamide-phosphate guanylyltransferase
MAAQARAKPGQPALPLAVRVLGRLVVVVGGGGAADHAVRGLLNVGARVRVVAPDVSAWLAELADGGLISVRNRSYQATDLDDAWLVLTCGPEHVNARAAADAEARRIWSVSGAVSQDAAAARGPTAIWSDSPLREGGGAERAPRHGCRVLVLGGARSGKSAMAESMLADVPAVDYVATGPRAGAGDAEWDERIRDHQARRPAGWRTLETCAVTDVLTAKDARTPVLVDCLSTWLAQVMEECGLWSGAPGADARLAKQADALVAAWRQTARHVVAVSNEVGCGVVPATASGRRFRDELGWLNSRIAGASEQVWLCTAGIPRQLR